MARHIRQKRVQNNNKKQKTTTTTIWRRCVFCREELPHHVGELKPHLHGAPTMEEITAGKHDEQRKQGKKKNESGGHPQWAIPKLLPPPSVHRGPKCQFHTGKSIFLQQELFDDFLAVCSVRKMQKMKI